MSVPPLSSFAPLIPLPSEPALATGTGPSSRGELEEKFASLFSPPTPPASPGSRSLTPIATAPASASTSSATSASRAVPRPASVRTPSSADSEFGSFVSVSGADDPLHALGGGAGGTQQPLTPSFEFFSTFADGAKAAADRSRHGLLDELLMHEDDPLYFLKAEPAGVVAGANGGLDGALTPTPMTMTRGEPEVHTEALQESLLDLMFGGSQLAAPPVSSPDLLGELDFDKPMVVSPAALPHSELYPQASPSPQPSPQPSQLIDIPPRASTPDTLASSSRHIPRTSSSGSFSSRWMPTILSRTSSRQPRASVSEERTPVEALFTPSSSPSVAHLSSSAHASSSSLLSSSAGSGSGPLGPHRSSPRESSTLPPSLPSHAASVLGTLGRSVTASLNAPVPTHENPFAAHTYEPPSGAPGFSGDRTWNKGFEFDRERVERTSVRLAGRKEVTTPVLLVEVANAVRIFMPALARLPRTWTLLYSLDQHGISLKTLYARCEAHAGSALLVVRDAGDGVFGAWVGEGIRLSRGSYYGGGESFMWRKKNKDKDDDAVQVFKWTGKNDYVALCEQEYISFGGGDGQYGLFLDDTLYDGSSARCPTFNNDPLCSSGPRKAGAITFECVGLEVWGIGP